MRTAIYPGSFDPLHNGHLDVIERGARLCDKIIIAVARNTSKDGLFSFEERVELIKEATWHVPGVEVDCFEGLLVDFANAQRADAIIRGLRAVSDFEYEFQMALMNRQLSDRLETIFLMPSQELIFLSSRMVKEIAQFGGQIEPFVPPPVAGALNRKLQQNPQP
ncbi:MAG: pantetheine-phosphate adenylyltransferase [Verrucomicrobiae bacterium]|nr:pantetheine-phosphate adenylyltransferase [Verrucomicrobiae bacterium]